jgi:hypothetical protein
LFIVKTPDRISVPGSKKGFSLHLGIRSKKPVRSRRFYQAGYLIGNIHQPEVHIERSPQRGGVFGNDREDKQVLSLECTAGGRTGIYIIREFRLERQVDLLRVIRPEPEDGFVLRQGKPLTQYGEKKKIKLFYPGICLNGVTVP